MIRFASLCRSVLALALPCGLALADDAPPKCLYVEVAQLPIRYTGPQLLPTVEGRIDGTPATLLLDTGAANTFLTRTGTDKRGLTLRSSGGATAHGVGGDSKLYTVRLNQFSVGPAQRGSTVMAVIDEMGSMPDYDGMVGTDFLMQTDLEIDFAGKLVKLYRARDCKDATLAYWGKDYFEVPFQNGGEHRTNPELRVDINGVALTAILDTGAVTSVITQDAARRAGVTAGSAGVTAGSPGVSKVGSFVGVGGVKAGRWTASFDSFKMGGEVVRNAAIDIRESVAGHLGVDVLLGADFIRTHRILIANSQNKVYFSYLGGNVFGAQNEGIAPWVQREADQGNPDAQLYLARRYAAGQGVAPDMGKARSLLDQAAAQQHVGAVLQQARLLRAGGKAADAVASLHAALSRHAGTPALAFELFLAQTEAGERAAAARELARFSAAFSEQFGARHWPQPVADFYLGKIDAPALMQAARADDSQVQDRVCQAGTHVADLARVMGDPARARQVMDSVLADCRRTPR